jgi:DNA-binding NarL/FixJ family response regulator
MDSVRVFVVSDSLMFSGGLKSLLSRDPDVEIIGEEKEVNRAVQQINTLQPDVIIWGNSGMNPALVQEEVRLVKATPGIKIIGLSLQSNNIVIYQSARKVVGDIQDLITAIKEDLFIVQPGDRQREDSKEFQHH